MAPLAGPLAHSRPLPNPVAPRNLLMHWSVERKVFGGVGAAWLIISLISLLSYQNARRADETTQIQQDLATLQETLVVLQAAETSQRGYLLTGADSYLEPYYSA